MSRVNSIRRERSPLILALALAVGLIAEVFGGPLTGSSLVGATREIRAAMNV